jgi:hypothetical protein
MKQNRVTGRMMLSAAEAAIAFGIDPLVCAIEST